MKISKTLVMTLAIVSLFAASKPVIAADAKTYPGAMCQRLFGSEITYDTNGEVANASSQFAALVVCPIVRDAISGNPGIERVRVHLRNAAEGLLNCNLTSFNGNGTQVDSDFQFSFTSGLNTFSLGPVRGGGNAADGYYTLFCILSATNSAIISYRVDEAD
jgi:hypothetical protein